MWGGGGGGRGALWVERGAVLAAGAALLLLGLQALLRLAKVLPYRVNCWFCNGNFWFRFPERNSWTCPACEQYNGFTKDGDYNKPLPNACDPIFKTPKTLQRTPPNNGLCKMCNINQELKMVQLANFFPMNENNFDVEVKSYRSQLEKAYRLCSRCRKVLKSKLHKEKETLLGSKLIENRSPKKVNPTVKESNALTSFIKYFSLTIVFVLLILISIDCYNHSIQYNSIRTNILRFRQMAYSLTERLATIVMSSLFMTFPSLHEYEDVTYSMLHKWQERYDESSPLILDLSNYLKNSDLVQMLLGGIGCFTQIVCHLLNRRTVKYESVTDILWVLIITCSIARTAAWALLPIKLSCATALFSLYKNIQTSSNKALNSSVQVTPKKMKNLARNNDDSWTKNDDSSEVETDDDVSLSQFGINNSDSSNDTKASKQPLVGGRVNPCMKTGSTWNLQNLNSSFGYNSPFNGSQYMPSPQTCYAVTPQPLFPSPQFNNCQKTENDDSDSELDECISGLHLGASPKKPQKHNTIFSMKQYNSMSPNFIAPSVVHQRPLISPSKLGQGMSWVAEGYWGAEGSPSIYNANGSRSSSQSSGFESHVSSMNQRNLFSNPPSREDSVCSEFDRISVFSDPITKSQYYFSANGFQQNGFVNRLKSPIHPTMRYDGYIHIPQSMSSQQMFAHSRPYSPRGANIHLQNNMFPPSQGSRLIKLPHCTS